MISAALALSACGPFEGWKRLHGKAYGSSEAAALAEAAYGDNCARYDELNRLGGATFGPDEHSDLSPEQFRRRFGGCYVDDPPPLAPAPPPPVARSASIDWRVPGQNPLGRVAVTGVKNQGAFGTCWSFAVAENLEGLNVRQGGALTNISEQEFISCCPDCQGRKAENSFEWLANATGGVPALESSWPYNGSAAAPCRAESAPRVPMRPLRRWGRVQDDGTGAPVVAGLHQHGPMGMGVDAHCFAGYKGGVIRNCTSKGVDHAVLMVAAGTEAGVKYFTIKNVRAVAAPRTPGAPRSPCAPPVVGLQVGRGRLCADRAGQAVVGEAKYDRDVRVNAPCRRPGPRICSWATR